MTRKGDHGCENEKARDREVKVEHLATGQASRADIEYFEVRLSLVLHEKDFLVGLALSAGEVPETLFVSLARAIDFEDFKIGLGLVGDDENFHVGLSHRAHFEDLFCLGGTDSREKQ